MKLTNEDLANIAEDARIDIISAKDNLQGINEFKEIYSYLEEALEVLNEKAEFYELEYEKECNEAEEYQNVQYRRSVL